MENDGIDRTLPDPHSADGKGPDTQPNWIRIRFRRSGPAEYLAHLDMMRLFERALRRAGIPLAYSQGFNPRPHLVFALPLGVGVQAEADIVDIETAKPVPPGDLAVQLDRCLPDGVSVRGAEAVIPDRKSVMGRVVRAAYRIRASGIAAAAESLMDCAELPVEKTGKSGRRMLDAHPLILSATPSGPDEAVFLVKAGSAENLRPDLLLEAMVRYAGLDPLKAANAEIIRERIELSDGNDG